MKVIEGEKSAMVLYTDEGEKGQLYYSQRKKWLAVRNVIDIQNGLFQKI